MDKTRQMKVGETGQRDFMALLGLTFLLCVSTVPRPWTMIHAFDLVDILNKPQIQKF